MDSTDKVYVVMYAPIAHEYDVYGVFTDLEKANEAVKKLGYKYLWTDEFYLDKVNE